MKYYLNQQFKNCGKQNKSISPPLNKATVGQVTLVGDRSIKFVYSTPAMDRDYDIIIQEGIDVNHYLTNPVVFLSHDHDSLPIGRTTSIGLENGNLVGVIEFAPFDNPVIGAKSQGVYELCRDGYLNTVSIGFIATEWNWSDDADRYARDGTDIHKAELVEVSIVGIPSNRGALIQEIGSDHIIEPLQEVITPEVEVIEAEKPKKFHSARLKRLLSVMD